MSYLFEPPRVSARYPAIGGGQHYDPDAFDEPTNHPTGPRITREDADVVVEDVDDFPEDTTDGTTFWIPGDVELDLRRRHVRYPAATDVTIASDRGLDGSPGALLFTDAYVHRSFVLGGRGSRFTSLRFHGADGDNFDTVGTEQTATGLAIEGPQIEVDNCQFRGFTHAGIEVGRNNYPNWANIHHNEFLDCNCIKLGYGITVFHGLPRIRANFFRNCRHAVAGDGAPDCAWRAMDNISDRHFRLHAWDMHEDGNTKKAGRKVILERNIILSRLNTYDTRGPSDTEQEAVSIRGIPREESYVRENVFAGREPTLPLRDSKNNAVNVFYADDWEDANVVGIDTNVFGWRAGDPIPDGVGPVQDESVTGYVEEPAATPDPEPPVDDEPPADTPTLAAVLTGTLSVDGASYDVRIDMGEGE